MNAAASDLFDPGALPAPEGACWDEPADDETPDDAERVDAAPQERRADAPDDAALAAWLARVARQDERALAALYDATAARVYGLVQRILQRPALAEEVVEDTFWQVWRQAPRFDAARGRPLTWLLAMARSRAIDALRREGRFRHEPLPAEAADDTDAGLPAAADLLQATQGAGRLHAALQALEPRSRQFVALAFFAGLTHEEIASRERLPLGTVKSTVRRALLQLRRVLEGGGAPAAGGTKP